MFGHISRASIRKLLTQHIKTDAELDAFCLDYFPEVKKQFGGGFSRTQKINLLLEKEDPDKVYAQLQNTITSSKVEVASYGRIRRWSWIFGAVFLVLTLPLIFFLRDFLSVQQTVRSGLSLTRNDLAIQTEDNTKQSVESGLIGQKNIQTPQSVSEKIFVTISIEADEGTSVALTKDGNSIASKIATLPQNNLGIYDTPRAEFSLVLPIGVYQIRCNIPQTKVPFSIMKLTVASSVHRYEKKCTQR